MMPGSLPSSRRRWLRRLPLKSRFSTWSISDMDVAFRAYKSGPGDLWQTPNCARFRSSFKPCYEADQGRIFGIAIDCEHGAPSPIGSRLLGGAGGAEKRLRWSKVGSQ